MLKPLFILVCFFSSTLSAYAKPPNIVTDIAPVYSLVSMVMDSDENVQLLLDGSQSPHDFALNPSQARALQTADLVLYVGLEFTPWLEKPLRNLASKSIQVNLLRQNDTMTLPYRGVEGQSNALDPHAWMSPDNAIIWLEIIADILVKLDSDNAQNYRQNAKSAKAKIATQSAAMKTLLEPVAQKPIVLFHDAFQYFEEYMGLNMVGAFTLADGNAPSPNQMKRIRTVFEEQDVACVFVEPSANMALIDAANARTTKQVVLDPLDVSIPLGTDYYLQLMLKTTKSINNCLIP
tara:strand:- start:15449 stop:16324 length:876 start_codon:yes stop_codon:yes gene_type:complete